MLLASSSGRLVADIVLINPRFELSFGGWLHAAIRQACQLASLCLALLCLVPDHHQVTLVDENVEDFDFDRLGRADLVGLTGMSIQGRRLVEILEECRSRGVMTVVGGPMATVEPEALEEFADVFRRRSGRYLATVLAGMGAGLPQASLRAAGKGRFNAIAAAAHRHGQPIQMAAILLDDLG